MYQSRLDYEYEQACEELAKHKKNKQDLIDSAYTNGLTSKEADVLREYIAEGYDEAFHRIIEEAKRVRDDYENKEQRAHESSERTFG